MGRRPRRLAPSPEATAWLFAYIVDPREYPEKIRKSKASPNAHRATKPGGKVKQQYLDDRYGYVLEGLLNGKTQMRIAEELGVSVSTVAEDFRRGQREAAARNAENADALRAELDADYALVIEAHRDRAQTDPRHAEVFLKAVAGRARLNGVEAPEVKDITIRAGATPAEARRVMQELFGGNVGPDTADAEPDLDAPDHSGPAPGAPTH